MLASHVEGDGIITVNMLRNLRPLSEQFNQVQAFYYYDYYYEYYLYYYYCYYYCCCYCYCYYCCWRSLVPLILVFFFLRLQPREGAHAVDRRMR